MKKDLKYAELETLRLSQTELWFLLLQFGPGVVLGFKDPTQGLLAKEINELGNQCFNSLHQRNLVQGIYPNQLRMDPKVSELIKGIHRPLHTVVCAAQQEPTAPTIVCAYHYTVHSIILLQEIGARMYNVSKTRSWGAIRQFLIAPFKDELPNADQGAPYRVSIEKLDVLRNSLAHGDNNSAQILLKDSGLESEDLTALLSALKNSQLKMSLLVFYHRQDPERQITKGFSVLAHERRIWLLELVGTQSDVASIRTISRGKLVERIRNILPRMETA